MSELHEAKNHVNVTVDMDEIDLTKAEKTRKPGCPEEKVGAIGDAMRYYQNYRV